MKLNKRYGRCVVCGKETILTYEHIPPRMAYNNSPVKTYSGFDAMVDDEKMPWDFSGRRYSNQQRGMGKYSLCRSCNSNTGSWYGNDYCEFVQNMVATIKNISIPKDEYIVFDCTDIYPLRIIKQVVSMFLTVNSDYVLDDLQVFVRDKYTTSFDKSKYQIRAYLNDGEINKFLPKSVVGKLAKGRGFIDEESALVVSEISTFPMGFILYFDPNDAQEKYGTDITSFCDVKYDDKCNVKLPLAFKNINTPIPCDFRSKEEVRKTVEASREYMKKMEKS